MQLQLLGPTRLLLPEGALDFTPERRYRLLAVLALAGEPVARERLATLFWPDRAAGPARTNLRKLVLEVRQLGIPGLDETTAGLRWLPPTDLVDFRAAVDAADWTAAAALLRGPPLLGLEVGSSSSAYDAWLQYERHRIVEPWRLGVLARLDEVDANTARSWTDALLRLDPLDEDAMAQQLRRAASGPIAERGRAQSQFRHYRDHLLEALALEPSHRLQQLAEDLSEPVSRAPARSPDDGRLVGRTDDLTRLQNLLVQPGCRQVTLLGPGGVGKTRLALALADRLSQAGRRVWFVPLDDLSTPSDLAGRVAEHVRPGLALQGHTLELLARHWPADAGLLFLDAMEVLIDAAESLAKLLQAVPGLQIVVTSRERLDIPAEWLHPVPTLGAPDTTADQDQVLEHPAVQLFVQRARQASPAFEPKPAWRALRGICQATDGLPLALELAASWARLMPCERIAADLESGVDWLDASDHRLRRSFEHSWTLLTPAERQAFVRLAIFRGGFDRRTAVQVADIALPVLAALADKSMLQVDIEGRFHVHAVLLEQAGERLAQDPALLHRLRERHADWALAYLSHHHGTQGGDHAGKRAAIARERANLLRAWQHWVDAHEGVALGSAAEVLSWFHVVEGRLPDAIALFERAANALGDGQADGAALRAHQAWLELWMRRPVVAVALARRVLPVLKRARHLSGCVQALRTLANAARLSGRHRESVRWLGEALRMARAAQDARATAVLLDGRAMAWIMLGRYRVAIRQLHGAIELNELVGNDAQRMYNDFNLSQAHLFDGDTSSALLWVDAGVRRVARIGYRLFEPYMLAQRAQVLMALGRFDEAGTDLHTATRLARQTPGEPARVWLAALQARWHLAHGEPQQAWDATRSGAALALASGDLMAGAMVVPAAAMAQRALGDDARARCWLSALAGQAQVQAPVQAEVRELLGPFPADPTPDLGLLLHEIAHFQGSDPA